MSDQMQSDLRQLDDALHCLVCFNRLREPKMCPKCSKIFCVACVSKWLQTHRGCPYCTSPLRLSELLQCTFVTEVALLVERMTKSFECYDSCADHGLQMLYFCKTCSLPLCSDCAMVTPQHKGHEFEKLSNMYEYHVRVLRNEEQKMNLRTEDLKKLLAEIDDNIDRLKQAHEAKRGEISQIMEQLKSRLEGVYKDRMKPLADRQSVVAKEIEQMQALYGKVTTSLLQKSKASVILQAPSVLSDLRQVNLDATAKEEFIPLSADFPSELHPSFESGAFIIEHFSNYRDSSEVLYSESLSFNGLSWRLKVYPNGNGFARGIYISLFLEMRSGLPGMSKFEYRVEMLNRRDTRMAIIREFTSEFESGECWGYNRFFRIDALEEEGYLDPEEDKVLLKFYVRSPDFPIHSKGQQRYIEFLEAEKTRQSARLTDLRAKLQNYESPAKALRLPSPPVVISAENPLEHVGDNMEVHSEDEPRVEEEKEEEEEEDEEEKTGQRSDDDLEAMTRKLKLLSKLRLQEKHQRQRLDSSGKEDSEERESADWQQDEEYCSSGSDLSELDVSRPNTANEDVVTNLLEAFEEAKNRED